MSSASHSFCLLMLVSFTTFILFNSHQFSADWDLRSKPEGSNDGSTGSLHDGRIVVEVSGQDNVGAEMLTRIRLLLGLRTSTPTGLNLHTHGSAPAPAPAEAVVTRLAPIPPFRKHANPRSPVHHKLHIHHSEERSRGGGKGKTVKWIVIAAVLCVGATISVLGTTFLLICKWSRRSRKSRSNSSSNSNFKSQIPSTATNKVSFDPGLPHLFYLNPLAPCPEPNHKFGQSFEPKYEERVCCLDEEIQQIQTSSSDDESYHSACNSHSSQEEIFHKYSPNCSPFSSHPLPSYHSHPAIEASSTPMNSRISITSVEITPAHSYLESTSIRSGKSSCNNNTTKATQSPPMIRNVNIPKPPPPPRPPSVLPSLPLKLPLSMKGHNNCQPPPPPPLPLKLPSPQVGCNSTLLPPPAPPHPLQHSTPVGKDGAPLPKLKPLHWDKVRAAPDRNMVWDKIRSNSFELDEEMIGSLFGYELQNSAKIDEAKSKTSSPSKHVLDHKRLQNVTILLKALNATAEQVSHALMEGGGLCIQQLEALVNMVLTKEEEGKLSNYEGDSSELDPAEQFIKAVLKIPFAFSRIEVMLYKETFEDEVADLQKSLEMLKEACKELRSSRLFLRLLEAVLRTGNRMNVGTARGGARAFKLDALLKLSDVKGTDGKTTLLHFVVQEMVRSEGISAMEKAVQIDIEDREDDIRLVGLNLVSGLSSELSNVKKTASIDLDVLATSVSNLSSGMDQLKHLVEVELVSRDDSNEHFVHSMKSFLKQGQRIIKELKDDEDQVLLHVKEMTEYYHGDVSKDEANPLRIFLIVRDFLGMLDRVCKEIRSSKMHLGHIRTVDSF